VLGAGRQRRPRPRLVYLSHNHEEGVARAIAGHERHILRRIARRLDALKVARLERTLVRHADLVTANTPDDCARFRAARAGRAVEFLPPGYGGPSTETRRITAEVPRRAIIVGSFDWIAKRVNLEQFLAVADRTFAQAGIELQVVGSAETAFLDRLRRQVVATTFTGRVDDVVPYMAQARVALVPDTLGGFKLKSLDYVFNRLPVLAMSGSVPGLPLRDGESIGLADDHRALARAVVEIIDDFDRLNGLQERAYAACVTQFDWPAIGRRLAAALSAVRWPAEDRLGLMRKPSLRVRLGGPGDGSTRSAS
jgi:glycosyltransferase involved in cell wall biosynthesis